jgi:hypothetical protein
LSNDGAPVCTLPNVGQQPPAQAGRIFPAIPKAQDLPSAVQAINTLTQIIIQLTAPDLPSFRNNLAPLTIQSQKVGTPLLLAGAQQNAQKSIRFAEVSRNKEKVKVVSPDDDSIFVIVERINSITFMDRVTGSLLVWQR